MGTLRNSAQQAVHGDTSPSDILDVALIGGGIMSATLGAMFAKLQPDWTVSLFERLNDLGNESSNPWNNAGTGHSGMCELNYMPDPNDSSKAEDIARQFHLSRQFWASLVAEGDLKDPNTFISATPHMDLVFGHKDVEYLRQRFLTLRNVPLFSAMEFSEDPKKIADWSPLSMEGRVDPGPVAATRYEAGTDVDFGALTKALVETMTASGAKVHLKHEVTALRKDSDGLWTLKVRDQRNRRTLEVRSRFVFVGAGGYALKLLQKAKIPEIRGYSVFPFGAQFLRTDNPAVVSRHGAKVYSQADLGAPPMSVPHLDKRVVDGESSLLFGPYATISTRLLKRGRLTDLFTTIKLSNIKGMLSVGLQNPSLVKYLLLQQLASGKRKFKELQRFYPTADPSDWRIIQAGVRAQLIKPGDGRPGVLMFGTELVSGADGTIAGLLGASPGASTAPSIMLDLLARCYPDNAKAWESALHSLVPALSTPVDADQETVDHNLEATGRALGLVG